MEISPIKLQSEAMLLVLHMKEMAVAEISSTR